MNMRLQRAFLILGSLALLALMAAAPARSQTVEVTSAEPSSAVQGTLSLDVTVNGNGFDSTAQVKFLVTGTTNPGGITVKKVSVRGSKKLIATIDVADSAAVTNFDIEVTLSSGRKGIGTTKFTVLAKPNNDPCSSAVEFPAFMFRRSSGTIGHYLSDSSGQCARFVSADLSSTARFAYPVLDDVGNPTNRARIVWKGRDPAAPTEGSQNMYFAMDVTIDGTSLTLGPAYKIADYGDNIDSSAGSACCGLDLSVDGREVYASTMPQSTPQGWVHSVVRIGLPGSLEEIPVGILPSATIVYQDLPNPTTATRWTAAVSVNASEDLLYIVQRYGGGLDRLLRADLDPDLSDTAGNPEVTLLVDPMSGSPGSIAADTSSAASDLIVFPEYSPADSCGVLAVMNGRTGTILNEGTSWLTKSGRVSWFGGRVLHEGAAASKNRSLGCRSTDNIVSTHPSSGATTTLVTGSIPDGR